MIQVLGSGWIRFVFDQHVDSTVHLVGDFNDWNEESHPMERQEDGTHAVAVRLDPGEYEYRYKSGCIWFNDADAQKYVPNCWGSENSVVTVERQEEADGPAISGGQSEASSLSDEKTEAPSSSDEAGPVSRADRKAARRTARMARRQSLHRGA